MIPKVIFAKVEQNYVIHIRFSDGTERTIDLAEELYGEIFEPLKNLENFRKVQIHPDFHTLFWPNGADFAPEFLYSKIQIPA
jgi:hypothetical protein